MNLHALTYHTDGAQRFPGAVADSLVGLRAILSDLTPEKAGVRFQGLGRLNGFLTPDGVIGSVAASVLGPNAWPVRAVLFDKTATTNWSLGWHQDRTICVKRRVETDGFGPWSIKAGMQHVTPPTGILARMVTLRVHFDDVSADNAPLLIAPGSHLEGRVAVDAIDAVVRRHETVACLAAAGDIWLYATLILHASDAATRPARRRVLQLDYACEDLPGELEWLGV